MKFLSGDIDLRQAIRLALCVGALLWLATGCVGIQADPNSDLPGNAPASWEGQTLGVPL